MALEPNVATAASLIADPARAAILLALLDGRALPAGELAFAAGVTAQTASSHLGKLLAGGMLTVESQGRHRYFRLASGDVAEAIERLAAILPACEPRKKALTGKMKELRFARCCYDHLAGCLGVAVTAALTQRGFIVEAPDKRYAVTPAGAAWFASIGLDVASLPLDRRGLARQCLDCTERTHHLAGPLGTHLLRLLSARGWLRRARDSRAVVITPLGQAELKRHLGVDVWEMRLRGADEPAAARPRLHRAASAG